MLAILAWVFLHITGCSERKSQQKSDVFLDIGPFSVENIGHNITVVQDGAGRKILLVPRGKKAPKKLSDMLVVHTPVRRVVAYRYFDVSALKVLGVLNTLTGVTIPLDKWHLPQIRQRIKKGLIKYIGRPDAIDFETLKRLGPDLVLTWDLSVIPMLNDLGIAAVITTTPVAMCLNARMKFVEFLAPFFQRRKAARLFYRRVKNALDDIKIRTSNVLDRPKVMWGDIYEKRVLVEPGNSWIGQLVAIVNSDYLFDDIYGASCIEINLERFIYSGRDADIYFTYRTPETGATSKDALKELNPLIADIKPLRPRGRVYAPSPDFNEQQDRLDEIFTEIAAILHPQLYPGYRLKFFIRLPEHDPKTTRKIQGEKR